MYLNGNVRCPHPSFRIPYHIFLNQICIKNIGSILYRNFKLQPYCTVLTGGAACILNQKNMVQKIYFPRQVLPIAFVTSQFINMLLIPLSSSGTCSMEYITGERNCHAIATIPKICSRQRQKIISSLYR